MRIRILIIVLAALLGFSLAFWQMSTKWGHAVDLSWPLRGAERLLEGENPYKDPQYSPENEFPFAEPLYYPMPAVLLVIPLTVVSQPLAGAIFAGISSGLLAFGLTRQRENLHRLLVFGSAAFYIAVQAGQWSPLFMAAFFVPALLVCFPCKPNLGVLPTLFGRDSLRWRWLLIGFAITILSVPLLPSWPLDWLANMRDSATYPPPLLTYFPWSLIFLPALLRWRETPGRLYLLLLVLPQRLHFYDQLFLWMIPRTWRGAIWLTAASWVGYYYTLIVDVPAWFAYTSATYLFLYLPALLVVLFEPRPEAGSATREVEIAEPSATA